MADITKACPNLPAPNVAETTAWYRDALGFSVHLASDGYGIVERDGVEIHFFRSDDRALAENTSVYLRTDNVDALYGTMIGAVDDGSIRAPVDREWGMREFYVWDPNGNLLRFGHPLCEEAAI